MSASITYSTGLMTTDQSQIWNMTSKRSLPSIHMTGARTNINLTMTPAK